MKNFHININQLVHLENWEDIKVLVDEKDLHLMEHAGVSDTEDNELHDLLIDVWRIHISQVDLSTNLESIISDTNAEEFYKLSMSDLR